MDIKSKFNEIIYIACFLCEEIDNLEKNFSNVVEFQSNVEYSAQLRSVIFFKNKLIEKII